MCSTSRIVVALVVGLALPPLCCAVGRRNHRNHHHKLHQVTLAHNGTNKTVNISSDSAAGTNITKNMSENVSHSATKRAAFLSKHIGAVEDDASDDDASSEENATSQTSDADAEDSEDDGEEVAKGSESSKVSKAQAKALEKVDKAQAKVALLEAKVDKIVLRQKTVAAEKEYMNDEQGFKTDMAKRVTMVANETQTKALAEFLGGMWTEMRRLSSPFYKQHLEDEGEEVKLELKKYKAKLELAEDEHAAAKKELMALVESEKEAKGKTASKKKESEEDESDEEDEKDDEDEKEKKEEKEDKKKKDNEATKQTPHAEAKDHDGLGLAHSAASRTAFAAAGVAAIIAAFFL